MASSRLPSLFSSSDSSQDSEDLNVDVVRGNSNDSFAELAQRASGVSMAALSDIEPSFNPASFEEPVKLETREYVAEFFHEGIGEHWQMSGHSPEELTPNSASAPTTSAATAASPALEDWSGPFNFSARFLDLCSLQKSKTWCFSAHLNKLYSDMDKNVQVALHYDHEQAFHHGPLRLRLLPVYSDPTCLLEPVVRCPTHSSVSDASNSNFDGNQLEHLIRVDHGEARYERDAASKRLSVTVPLQRPQTGLDYNALLLKFMCLGSDAGGINRRSVKLVLTLECNNEVIGRRVFDLRLCSCPRRDCAQEERRSMENTQRQGQISRPVESHTVVVGKKRKVNNANNDFVMVAVSKADLEALDEIAEALALKRQPGKEKEIKAQRKRLFEEHNVNRVQNNVTKTENQ